MGSCITYFHDQQIAIDAINKNKQLHKNDRGCYCINCGFYNENYIEPCFRCSIIKINTFPIY